jgi:predicted GNAT family acetyltransferase
MHAGFGDGAARGSAGRRAPGYTRAREATERTTRTRRLHRPRSVACAMNGKPASADDSDRIRFGHDPAKQRFFAETPNGVGVLEYSRIDASTLDFRHTFVPRALRRRGLATRLVEHALEHVRENGLKVVPSCPFVAVLMRRRAKYRALAAGPGRDGASAPG